MRMFVLLLLVLGSIPSAIGQGFPEPTQEDIDTYLRYSYVFDRIGVIERLADLAIKSGKDSKGSVRGLVKREAGLSDREDLLIREAAKTFRAEQLAIAQRREQIIGSLKPAKGSEADAIRDRLASNYRESIGAGLKQISSLRANLGESRFQQFDAYARSQRAEAEAAKGLSQNNRSISMPVRSLRWQLFACLLLMTVVASGQICDCTSVFVVDHPMDPIYSFGMSPYPGPTIPAQGDHFRSRQNTGLAWTSPGGEGQICSTFFYSAPPTPGGQLINAGCLSIPLP